MDSIEKTETPANVQEIDLEVVPPEEALRQELWELNQSMKDAVNAIENTESTPMEFERSKEQWGTMMKSTVKRLEDRIATDENAVATFNSSVVFDDLPEEIMVQDVASEQGSVSMPAAEALDLMRSTIQMLQSVSSFEDIKRQSVEHPIPIAAIWALEEN
jgi:hypothetical protein